MFADKAKITIKAGDGGNGAVSFRREKYVPSGGPDGGDGGRGGNVVFVPDTNLSTLADFRYKRKFVAPNGSDGSGSRKNGKKGEDLIIKIPAGTLIREAVTGKVFCDMTDKESFVAARGGNGGWGNWHFKNSVRQAPRFAKDGIKGETFELTLELKLLADVGIIGFPNVGKSTLISVATNAKPQIGNYHFTTVTPNLGVVENGAGYSFVMADIPGLVEGAGDGVGLGHEFLRHVERCRMLIHVVDVSGSEGRDPAQDFETVNRELYKFDKELASLPQIVAGNKTDLASDKARGEFREYIENKGLEYFEICAPISEGTNELLNACAAKLSTLPPIKRYEREFDPIMDIPEDESDVLKVFLSDDGVYEVESKRLSRILLRTDTDDYESLGYFQKILSESGALKELESLGINEGDTVRIGGLEFEYVP